MKYLEVFPLIMGEPCADMRHCRREKSEGDEKPRNCPGWVLIDTNEVRLTKKTGEQRQNGLIAERGGSLSFAIAESPMRIN